MSTMSGEKRKRAERQKKESSYLFLSGSLALDLVNTEIVVRGKRRDLLTSVEDVAAWWHEALRHHPDSDKIKVAGEGTQWNTHLFEPIKTLRTALHGLFTCLVERQPVHEADLDVLNRVLALGYRSLQAGAGGKLFPIYQADDHPEAAILLPIALSAFHLIAERDRNRLHKCKNERCVLFFYDTTKSATRDWCSLSCMNRARSIQHYRQTKG